MLKRNVSTHENREFWAFVDATAKDVAENFPAWKRGDKYIWECGKCRLVATEPFPQNTCIGVNQRHDWMNFCA